VVERSPKTLSQLLGVVVRPEMDEKQPSSLSDWSLADPATERRVGIRLGGGGWIEQVGGVGRVPATSISSSFG
jgi:hypothetical protein